MVEFSEYHIAVIGQYLKDMDSNFEDNTNIRLTIYEENLEKSMAFLLMKSCQ